MFRQRSNGRSNIADQLSLNKLVRRFRGWADEPGEYFGVVRQRLKRTLPAVDPAHQVARDSEDTLAFSKMQNVTSMNEIYPLWVLAA